MAMTFPAPTTLLEWIDRPVYALSPERRRLLRTVRDIIQSRGFRESEKLAHLRCVDELSYSRRKLSIIASHSDRWHPIPIARVIESAEIPGDPRRLTELNERHFTICREMSELSGLRYLELGRPVLPEHSLVQEAARTLLHHALHNTDDWELISSLLKGRKMWSHKDVMETLCLMRSTGSSALVSGSL